MTQECNICGREFKVINGEFVIGGADCCRNIIGSFLTYNCNTGEHNYNCDTECECNCNAISNLEDLDVLNSPCISLEDYTNTEFSLEIPATSNDDYTSCCLNNVKIDEIYVKLMTFYNNDFDCCLKFNDSTINNYRIDIENGEIRSLKSVCNNCNFSSLGFYINDVDIYSEISMSFLNVDFGAEEYYVSFDDISSQNMCMNFDYITAESFRQYFSLSNFENLSYKISNANMGLFYINAEEINVDSVYVYLESIVNNGYHNFYLEDCETIGNVDIKNLNIECHDFYFNIDNNENTEKVNVDIEEVAVSGYYKFYLEDCGTIGNVDIKNLNIECYDFYFKIINIENTEKVNVDIEEIKSSSDYNFYLEDCGTIGDVDIKMSNIECESFYFNIRDNESIENVNIEFLNINSTSFMLNFDDNSSIGNVRIIGISDDIKEKLTADYPNINFIFE